MAMGIVAGIGVGLLNKSKTFKKCTTVLKMRWNISEEF